MLKQRGKKGNHPNAGIQDSNQVSKKSAACTACNLNFRMSGIQLMSKLHTVIFAEKNRTVTVHPQVHGKTCKSRWLCKLSPVNSADTLVNLYIQYSQDFGLALSTDQNASSL